MTEVVGRARPGLSLGRIASLLATRRELSLVVIMVGMGLLVALQAPQFLSASNLTQVSVFASIVAIAAVGQAIVIITRNVDLSVEAMIGLVAFVVADLLRQQALGPMEAMLVGVGLGLVLGMVNGLIVVVLRVPAIVATLGTLSLYRGIDFLLAGGKQVTFTELPAGYSDPARWTIVGVPLFVLIAVMITGVAALAMRQTRMGRNAYAVGSNPDAARVLGIRAGVVIFVAFAVCGLLAGVAGVLWGIEFGTINATAASGMTLQIIAAVVVGGVNIFGGSGSVVGAGLGAVFLAFVANALILLRISQFWLEALFGVVILVAITLDSFILRSAQRRSGDR
jgi:rhamnose transport system permease protein